MKSGFIKAFYQDLKRTDCLNVAASLAYMTLFSLVPIFSVGLLVFQRSDLFSRMSLQFEKFLFDSLIPSSAKEIQQYMHQFAQHATALSYWSAGLLLITAVFLIFNIEQAFNRIWKVKKSRNFIAAFFIYTAVLVLIPLLGALAFLVGSEFSFLLSYIPLADKDVYQGLAFIFVFLIFLFLYRVLPHCKVSYLSASVGALAATLIFQLAKAAFRLYVHYVPTYTVVYGAFATIPILLIWLYFIWLIVLVGAQVAAAVRS